MSANHCLQALFSERPWERGCSCTKTDVYTKAYIAVNSLDYKHTLSEPQDGQHFPVC